TRFAQAAMMVLKPKQETSEQSENEHLRSEQWVFVISGTGRATVRPAECTSARGDLLLIEKREPHRIRISYARKQPLQPVRSRDYRALARNRAWFTYRAN
ncbi:MAG: cupin domain-containing protein, partial [Gammaproteobacteria bacterium]|nr:cupin domain-containing protein [Gammaproteobacteria bacterium]